MLRAWLELARISNLPTVWTNVLAGWLLAGGTWNWSVLAWLLSGGSLLYTGGMILNDATDVKFDREQRVERPIPSGRVSACTAWSVGLSFLFAGFVIFVWNAGACIWLTGALVAAIVIYDLYHKPWAGSVFIMGSCRTLLYLAAASAVTGTLSFAVNHEVIIKAIALGAYVVGVSLAARRESGTFPKPLTHWAVAGLIDSTPMLVGVYYMGLHRVFDGFSFVMLLAMINARASSLFARPAPANIGRGVSLLLAGIVLVDALAVSTVAPLCALIFALSFPLLLLWQRKIAAT